MENVIELETQRQNRDLKETNSAAPNRDDDRNIMEAMWWGLEHSRWSKDPNNPDPNAPGSLGFFMTKVADASPAFFMQLLAKYCIEPPKD